MGHLRHRVFDGLGLHYADTGWISSRAVITTKNVHLEEINGIVGAMLPGELRVYKSHNYVQAEDGQHILRTEENEGDGDEERAGAGLQDPMDEETAQGDEEE